MLMRVKIQQFLFGANHSWAVTGKEIGRSLLKQGHSVDFVSTDGVDNKFIPKDLEKYVRLNPSGVYDCQFSYTAMMNFPKYLDPKLGGKRFGMWAYEFDVLPDGFPKYAEASDYLLSPSDWFRDICIKNKISEAKVKTLHHGVNWEAFENAEPLKLKTDKKIKILVNFAQPHLRKNIRGTLEAFGKAFTNKDDVCLVLKVKDLKPRQQFEVSFTEEYNLFKKKFPNHAETLILKDYIPSIESLYKSCQVFFMIPKAEAFFLPALEALASDQIVITSNYGGQLDFLNKENSILINGKEERADRKAFYWNSSSYGKWFVPDINEAAEKLRNVCLDYDNVKMLIKKPNNEFKEKFSWDNCAKVIEKLCEEK